MNGREMVREHLPEWRFESAVSEEPFGVLVKVQRHVDGVLKLRQVWIARDGKVTDARLDSLGYLIDARGCRLEGTWT